MSVAKNFHMEEALKLAQEAFDQGEVPVGAVLVESQTGKILGRGKNAMHQLKNPLLHAEMQAIQDALINSNQERFWGEVDLYVTLEPCPMCAAAISLVRIQRLYFGAYDPKGGGIIHGPRVLESSSCLYKPEVYGGICEEESATLLKQFFQNKR